MAVSVKIKNLAPGAYFNAGPVEVVVLEHFTDGRTLLAAKEPIGNRPFTVRPFTYNRMEPEPAANNFAFSTLRFDLNKDFLSALDDAGVIPANKVLEAEWSLADHDGTNRYGVAVCKVAMLPEPLVRKYYDAGLLEIDDWEWTITPSAGNAYYVRLVYSGGGAKRNVTRHYHTMKTKDIYDLPVQDIAADDCLLFMWATFPNLEVALETIRRWGFQYKTAAFVWVKRNRKSPGWFWGLGNWTRANPEVCLLATKGKPIRASRSVHSIIDAPIGRHSEKPAETRDRIAALAGGGAMIELFARQAAPGWDAWGDEAPQTEREVNHEHN